MGLRDIYQQIEQHIDDIHITDTPTDHNIGQVSFNSLNNVIKHRHTWNNQFESLLKTGGAQDCLIPFPAAFMEVIVDNIETQGVGNQLWNCRLKLHIAHYLLNAQDGEFEQNWEVFDLVDKVHTHFHGWKPDRCNTFIETNLTQDYSHDNLYHFIMEYKFNYENNWETGYIQSGAPLHITFSGSTIKINNI